MTFEVVYECPDGTPFPVEWSDAAMTEHGWRWDQLHNPTPMTPLSQDLSRPKNAGMIRAGDQTGHVFLGERIYAHGYVFSRSPDATEEKRRLFREIAERDVISRMDRLIELWESSYRPEVDVLTRSLRSWANPDDTADNLMKRFDEIEAIIGRLGELHELTMGLANTAAAQFSRLCREEFGEDGVHIAEAAVAGLSNKSLESAEALWQLSRQAQSMPKVAGLLRERSGENFLNEVDGVENGGEFRLLLDEFLDEWGQRNESFNELAFQTWREDPRFVVSTITAYLDVPDDRSPTVMNRRVAEAREAITAEAEERLADPEKIDAFRLAQRRAQQRTVLIEDHNFSIDQRAFSTMRAPCLAIGKALMNQGAIDEAGDVFFLHRNELSEAAEHPGLPWGSIVEERKQEWERWTNQLPPSLIGEGKIHMEPEQAQRQGFLDIGDAKDGEIPGLAASGGQVQGTARLILTLQDAHRFKPGDILVTYSTAPPWTPLFAIAAAVVTDSGGPLSHCAIVAREYGIPAVVGTKVATAQIKDGTSVTVDGTNGVVTFEE